MGKKAKKRKDILAKAYREMTKRRDDHTDEEVVEEVCRMAAEMLSGYEHEVIDKRTGEDVTEAYLAMLIAEMNRRNLRSAVERRMFEFGRDAALSSYLGDVMIEGVQA